MKLRVAVGLASFVLLLGPAAARQPARPGEAPLPADALFRLAREQITTGRYDVAGETLKRFLELNPPDEEYLRILNREPTAFLKLRNVVTWSENPTANAEYKKVVDDVIQRSEAASKRELQNPARIERFVRNLGESPEERAFAVQQLRLSGDAVVPTLVNTLATTADANLRFGALAAVRGLNAEQLPGILAAVPALPPEIRLGILQAAVARPDARALSASPDTDLYPHLWYYAASREATQGPLREFAALTLENWVGTVANRSPVDQLVAIARPLTAGEGRFRNTDPVSLWQFDAEKQTVASQPVSVAAANDYFALRAVRWALERKPDDADATDLFIKTATERAVQRSEFGSALTADPALLPVLAAAPAETLIRLLEQALVNRQPALALGLTQVLSARRDRTAAGVGLARPSVFVRALDYPDPRVQLAAAVGLLRVPGSVPAERNARIVEILARAAAAGPQPGADAKGRALIADPDDARGAKLAAYLRPLGYRAERVTTGRALARQLRTRADADLIFIDQHIADPELRDLVSAVQVDANAAGRAVFIVASANQVQPLTVDRLLLRLAFLVAITETSELDPPAPFAYDPRRPVRPDTETELRESIIRSRDKVLAELYTLRLARLERLVSGAGLPASQSLQALLDLRLPQLTYAALCAEYSVTSANAPVFYQDFVAKTRTLAASPPLVRATRNLDVNTLTRIVEDLDGALDAKRREQFETLLAQMDPAALILPAEAGSAPPVDESLQRLTRSLNGVRLIAEPASAQALADDLRPVTDDPALKPTPDTVKREDAKLALTYLRKMAVGEITGFDVSPAESALRAALRHDDTAPLALDAVARIGTPQAQEDLLNLVIGVGRPVPLKIQAADAAIQHVQAFGRLVPLPQLQVLATSIPTIEDPTLKAQVAVLEQLLRPRGTNLNELISNYPLQSVLPPPAAKPKPEGEPGATPPAEGTTPPPDGN